MARWSKIIELPGGGRAIICGSGQRNRQRCTCGAPATLQCDWPTVPGKTCDAFLCTRCAVHDGPNRDFCADHRQDAVA